MSETSPEIAPKLAIVAGGGPLPLSLADAALGQGREILVVGFEGISDRGIEAYPHVWVRLGAFRPFFDAIKGAGCTELTMIGPFPRPDLRTFRPDGMGLRLMPRIVALFAKGDDGLLSGIVEWLEKEHGLTVVGAHEIASGLLAPAGQLGRVSPDEQHLADIALAARAAELVGELDVGQGSVACNGVVVALEAAEGTDAMLQRVAGLPPNFHGTAAKRAGVLVKRAKPSQDHRVDLPTIGVRTVELAAEAGLAGIAVSAGAALISDLPAVVSAANRQGLFLLGLEADVAGGVNGGG